MSNSLTAFANAVPVRGINSFVPINVFECAPVKTFQLPATVPVVIKWDDYKNVAGTATPTNPISINLQYGVQGQPIHSIKSIKIDNLSFPSSVTVYFPDTGDEIVCAAFSTTRANVMTGGFQCIVLSSLQTSNLGKQSTIFFNNFPVDTADVQDTTLVENLEQATGSPFSLNTLSPRAKGDRFQRVTLDLTLTGGASQVAIFGGPPDGYNFIVLTEMHFRLLGNYLDAATPVLMNASFIDNTGFTNFNWSWYSRNDLGAYYGDVETLVYTNVNAPAFSSYVAAATFRKWFVQNNVAGLGKATVDLVYTLVNVTNF